MAVLIKLGTLRVALTVLTGITALYFTLVALNNILDYGTNKQFVEHVLAMDTTFKDPDVMWRSIESPTVVTIAYVAVIAWETLTAAVLIIALVTWLRRGQAEKALRLSVLGWIMVVLLFAGGFIGIGGEWFQMWQSSAWNGLEPALQNVLIASVGLILALRGMPSVDGTATHPGAP